MKEELWQKLFQNEDSRVQVKKLDKEWQGPADKPVMAAAVKSKVKH
jgi:hypothetical protein